MGVRHKLIFCNSNVKSKCFTQFHPINTFLDRNQTCLIKKMSSKFGVKYLSVAYDDCWPKHLCIWFQSNTRMDTKSENDIKMTNDTRDKQDCQDSQENDPKYAPLFALCQGNVDKSVCWCPKIKSWNRP